MRKLTSVLLATMLLGASLTGCGETENSPGSSSRLDAVKNRGQLICGVEGNIPGFSFVDQSGSYSGIDVDVCKAVAAALFNDPNAVEYRNLDSTERFTALTGGEVDMLSRNRPGLSVEIPQPVWNLPPPPFTTARE